MSNAGIHSAFESHRSEIVRLIASDVPIHEIERRFDEGRVGRISRWFQSQYRNNPTVFRRRIANRETAVVSGDVYFFSAPDEVKRRVVRELELKHTTKRPIYVPGGVFHIWIFDGVVCVSNATNYVTEHRPWVRIYHDELDTNWGTDLSRIGSPEYSEIPLTSLDIAAQFGLVWLPEIPKES